MQRSTWTVLCNSSLEMHYLENSTPHHLVCSQHLYHPFSITSSKCVLQVGQARTRGYGNRGYLLLAHQLCEAFWCCNITILVTSLLVRESLAVVCVTRTYNGVNMYPSNHTYVYSNKCSHMLRSQALWHVNTDHSHSYTNKARTNVMLARASISSLFCFFLSWFWRPNLITELAKWIVITRLATFIWKRWFPRGPGEFICTTRRPPPPIQVIFESFLRSGPKFCFPTNCSTMDVGKAAPPGRRKNWMKGYNNTMRMQNQAKLAAGTHQGHDSRKNPPTSWSSVDTNLR